MGARLRAPGILPAASIRLNFLAGGDHILLIQLVQQIGAPRMVPVLKARS
jgi:hypothetical protein